MKIENGCLAVVINSCVSSNIGKCVRVIRFIGKVKGFECDDRWSIDEHQVDNTGDKVYHQREINLMRIDGIKEPEATLETKSLNNSEV